MKQTYIDKFGNDSLVQLKIAVQAKADVFITNNKELIADREEIEKTFGILIRKPHEALKREQEMKK